MDLFEHVQRGDPLTIALLVGGIVVVILAIRLVSFASRLLMLLLAAGLVAGVAPWSGTSEVVGEAAACAANEARDAVDGWQGFITQRITVSELSGDAECAEDGGLARGSGRVVLRTVYDVPIGRVDVSAG